jgi:fermentation-respiration switch protein FrsA (DUF1100 family)
MTSVPRALEPTPRRRRWTAARIALTILVAILVVYGGAILWLVTQETRLVFQAGRPLGEARPSFPYEQVAVPREDGTRQFGWIMRNPDARAWVLFLHGNSATIASRVNIARYRELRRLGLNVFAPEYRGFGGLPGVPSEAGLAADARAAFDYLIGPLGTAPTRVVIYGWSLGSAVAVRLASEVAAGAVILEGAPASLVDLGQQEYPFFPVRLLMQNPFDSILRIGRVDAPVLFLHSPADDIVPIAHGRRLYEAARAPKRFVEVQGGHIYANDVDGAVFYGAIRGFLGEHGLLGAGTDGAITNRHSPIHRQPQ